MTVRVRLNPSRCVNRDMIDEAAQTFCYHNTAANRTRLADALYFVPRNRLDLLPYYARLVATLKPGIPELATNLVSPCQATIVV